MASQSGTSYGRSHSELSGSPDKSHHGLPTVVQRNIETLRAARKESDQQRTLQDRIADAITAFSGNMLFVYFHVLWFGTWINANLGWKGLTPFDPYPFGMLTTIVSLEAIFLSTFVLISQNRQSRIADRRADLNLQMDLLAEHEVTRLLCVVDAIATKLNVAVEDRSAETELKAEIHPDDVLHQLEKADADQSS